MLDNIIWHGSNMGSFRQGNGLTTTLSYDAAGRLTDKTFGADNALQNQLDKQSQIIEQSWLRNGVNEDIAYQYDALSRLITDGNSNNQFTYDAVGNRLSETQANTSYAYEVNTNRLSQVNAVNIQRDAAGNTLDDGIRQYQYNAMNRLAGLSNSQNNVQAVYTYNYLGQRVRKQLSGAQTDDIRYVYGQQGELLGEYRSDGLVIREYIYQAENGIAELIAEVDESSALVYVHTDHLGTPRLATDDNQLMVWRWDSDAFGTTAVNDDPDGDSNVVVINHRFAGQYFDEESGLYYNYFRYYEPQTGRYITSDPLGLIGSDNPYVYVGGNSLSGIDPLGLYNLMDFVGDTIKFTAGFGDALTFGGTTWIAKQFMSEQDAKILDRVRRCSGAFKAGGWASLGLGVGRLAYAGIAKGASLFYASRGATMANAAAATAFRNILKRAFRLNPWSTFRVYPFKKLVEKYGTAEAIIAASGRTNGGAMLWEPLLLVVEVLE